MYVNIKIESGGKKYWPKGFYYKGEGKKMKVVIVGCDKENHYKKTIVPFEGCWIQLTKINEFGDEFSI